VCEVGGEIHIKPVDRDDAERMIRRQEGRESRVLTAICLMRADRSEWVGTVEDSTVWFRSLSDAERTAYLASNRWEGKSGAYGVQDDDPFVSIVRGSYSNVVGLPIERLAELFCKYPELSRP
jgi:septum formation protein